MSVVIRSHTIKMDDGIQSSNCSCCPYGYHIDIDFVRYCEAVAIAELSDGQRQRRYKRRQTKSMEVMLGLESTIPLELLLRDQALIEVSNENDFESPSESSTNWTKRKFDENRIYLNDESLEDVCNDFERTLERSRFKINEIDFKLGTTDSEISKNKLENIREQMSQSLCRMRDLEEQVKIIPMLQLQLSILNEEKRLLKNELEKKQKITTIFQPKRINSVSLKISQPQKLDVAVMCSILTRDVGISTNLIKTRTIALQSDESLIEKKQTVTIGTQMNLKIIKNNSQKSQTMEIKKIDFSSIFKPETRTLGSSDDKVIDEKEKNSISLKQMDDKKFSSNKMENFSLKKNQSTQYQENLIDKKTISTQTSVNTINKSSQKFIDTNTKTTTTFDLIKLIDSSINTKKIQLNDFGINTEILPIKKDVSCGDENISPHILIKCSDNYCDTCKEHIKNLAKIFSLTSTGYCIEQTNLSKIPRPKQIKNDKKFIRQDTYTINGGKSNLEDLSENLQIKTNENEENDKMCSNAKEQEINIENPSTSQQNNYKTEKPRIKSCPTKEMLGALKVINDSIKKNSTINNLTNANGIVQNEWFKISSTDTANPLDVENYLDCFEDFSNDLLKYMVNLIDTNGNTAMHYAVSHGNYDIVSILLDSKVCNVNQKNNAGYTCVMLVSLAKLKISEHKMVVERLFLLSDVNLKATKHNQTALMLAVSHGNIEMVQILLEAGAEINIQDEDGSTALMCAAEHGRIDIVKILLAKTDCDSSIQDMDGSTALKISLEAGHRDIGVLLYAHNHMSKNKSPYTSLRHKKKITEPKKK